MPQTNLQNRRICIFHCRGSRRVSQIRSFFLLPKKLINIYRKSMNLVYF